PMPNSAPVVVTSGPFISPSPPHEKKPFTVNWTFENVGNSDSSETQVDLYIDNVKEGDTKTVSKLASGKVAPISWSVTKQYTGFAHTAEIRSVSASGPVTSLGFGQFTMEP